MADNQAFQREASPPRKIELQEVNLDNRTTFCINGTEKEDHEDIKTNALLFSVQDVPPWYLSISLGLQQYLTMFGGTLAAPLVVASLICVGDDYLAQTEILGTMFFVCGVSSLLQTLLGARLPIIQGGTFSFIAPIAAIMSLPQWQCPSGLMNSTEIRDAWRPRMCEVQGAVMVASLFEVVIAFTGLIGLVMRFIGPLTIAPTISLIGLALVKPAVDHASTHWGIAFGTIFLITLFSQYLRNIRVPVCSRKDGKWIKSTFPLFSLFPVILSIILIWILCIALTAADVFPSDPNARGYKARTDIKTNVLYEAAWFRFPYPGQWGMPTVSVGGVFGMLAGVLASMVESIGDYYACARLAGAPPPPTHAVNRGLFMEGIGCLLAGALGSGTGTTSYSENVGAIGITKVGSRRVVEVSGLLMIILGVFGKFGALFVTLPEPVIGGIFMTMFGMVTAVGLSNLQFVDLNSPRNLFIVGFSIICGLAVPFYITSPEAEGVINTGNISVDQILTVLLSTSMFIGGLCGALLDNTIPGTKRERGLLSWNELPEVTSSESEMTSPDDVYDLPFRASRFLKKVRCFKYLPICPVFSGWNCSKCDCCSKKGKDFDLS